MFKTFFVIFISLMAIKKVNSFNFVTAEEIKLNPDVNMYNVLLS